MKEIDGRLPDGSGFFIAEIGGRRPPGFIGWMKYTQTESGAWARGWLYFWRNYRDARIISSLPGQGPPLSYWRAFRYALSVNPFGWKLF